MSLTHSLTNTSGTSKATGLDGLQVSCPGREKLMVLKCSTAMYSQLERLVTRAPKPFKPDGLHKGIGETLCRETFIVPICGN